MYVDRTLAPAEGGTLVSLNPLRETLEDFFVEKVEQTPGKGR